MNKILITGGGGSIGQALCRELLDDNEVYILSRGENTLYNAKYGQKILCDVTNGERLKQVFDRCDPNIVFHAAAHKHVSFMERFPEEAVLNNIIGTINVISQCKVRKLINVSTDKAIDPIGVMGMAKRICEKLVSSVGCSVRFGNVICSRGSVIPAFKKQIESGGPVIVTDPGVSRYFISMKQAIGLLCFASKKGHCGDIYTLNMGNQIYITDVAKILIGDKDIDIEFSALGESEKLQEAVIEGDNPILTETVSVDKGYMDKVRKLIKNVYTCNVKNEMRKLI